MSGPAFIGDSPMSLKLVVAVSLLAAVPIVAYAQKNDPAAEASGPTVADAQKFVQTVSSDPAKLKAYCDMGKLKEQIEKAEQKMDVQALETLGAKADSLSEQLGPDYVKMMAGLDEADPNSDEGKRFAVAFEPLDKQCK
jgi:hypothetical protein